MTAITNFLQGIAEGFQAIIAFVQTLIEDTAYIAQLLGEFVVQIPDYLSFLPAPVLTIIVTLFTVVVIYKILGRD